MENVLLVVLLILALALIGVVLLQRSEGGGLGMGGGGGVMSGRAQANALTRATWWLGGAFMAASVLLTVISAENAGEGSVVDRVAAPDATAPTVPDLGGDGSLLPPPAGGTDAATGTDAPLVPAD